MKRSPLPLILGTIVLAICSVGGVLFSFWRSSPVPVTDGASARPAAARVKQASEVAIADAQPAAGSLEELAPISAPRKPKGRKPAAQDPSARVALSMVGVEAISETVWTAAINNPRLPAQERQDLIEDLNEDGLSNKKQPTAADLPLIRARLALIDRLMPEAMDKTNADAFAEAKKDLLKMEAELGQ